MDFPEVQTSGPCLANAPESSDTWWTNWASFVSGNGSIPDQYDWHMESGSGDMQTSVANLNTILSTYGLPQRTININEYAIYNEQVPCGGAWWISQLERVNALGLRGNWLSAAALHDFMAGLVGKPNAGTSAYNASGGGYWPTAEFQVYKYYTQNMTGYRVATTPTLDISGDVYATVDRTQKVARLLIGARVTTGNWNIQLNGLSTIGLPTSGTLNIHTYKFSGNSGDHEQEFDGTTDLGVYGHTYSGNTVTFPIYQTDAVTTWAFEFATG